MTEEDKDEACGEFGHQVAAIVKNKIPPELWPKDEMEGFHLFHAIVDDASKALRVKLDELYPANCTCAQEQLSCPVHGR